MQAETIRALANVTGMNFTHTAALDGSASRRLLPQKLQPHHVQNAARGAIERHPHLPRGGVCVGWRRGKQELLWLPAGGGTGWEVLLGEFLVSGEDANFERGVALRPAAVTPLR